MTSFHERDYLLLEHRLSQAPSDEAKAEIRAAVANPLYHGPTSTYWASTTSPTKSSAIPLEFHLPKIASEITPRNGTSKNGF